MSFPIEDESRMWQPNELGPKESVLNQPIQSRIFFIVCVALAMFIAAPAQAQRDFEAFTAAIASGRIKAQEG